MYLCVWYEEIRRQPSQAGLLRLRYCLDLHAGSTGTMRCGLNENRRLLCILKHIWYAHQHWIDYRRLQRMMSILPTPHAGNLFWFFTPVSPIHNAFMQHAVIVELCYCKTSVLMVRLTSLSKLVWDHIILSDVLHMTFLLCVDKEIELSTWLSLCRNSHPDDTSSFIHKQIYSTRYIVSVKNKFIVHLFTHLLFA